MWASERQLWLFIGLWDSVVKNREFQIYFLERSPLLKYILQERGYKKIKSWAVWIEGMNLGVECSLFIFLPPLLYILCFSREEAL